MGCFRLLAILLALVLISGCSGILGGSGGEPNLQLLWSKITPDASDWLAVTGEIRNFGDGTAKNTEVVVQVYSEPDAHWYDKGVAVIDQNDLGPKQTIMFIYRTFIPSGVTIEDITANVYMVYDTP